MTSCRRTRILAPPPVLPGYITLVRGGGGGCHVISLSLWLVICKMQDLDTVISQVLVILMLYKVLASHSKGKIND